MRLSNGLIGAGAVVAGAAIFDATLRFPRLDGGAPGPALFPQVLSALLILVGANLAVQAWTRRREPDPAATRRPGARGVVNALAVFAAIIAFMGAAPFLGFLLTAAAILCGLMWRLGARPVTAALVSAGLTLFVYVIFGKILRVPLPLGLVWF